MSYVVQAILALHDDCGFPHWVSYGMMMYMVTMISLFMNFYLNTYRTAGRKQEASGEKQNNSVQSRVENGSAKKLN